MRLRSKVLAGAGAALVALVPLPAARVTCRSAAILVPRLRERDACANLAAAVIAARAAEKVGEVRPGSLEELAARAVDYQTWPALRQFASSAEPELRGEAYFVLGYREYEAEKLIEAAEDFRKAAETKFSLADFAEYFRALAVEKAKEPAVAAETLEGFAARHPASSLRYEALGLFAESLLSAGEAQRAVEALSAGPEIHKRPTLALLLAQALRQAGRLKDSAGAYQEVYSNFPTRPQAKAAGEALEQLRRQLGKAAVPSLTTEMQSTRAEILLNHARYREALGEYERLLREHRASPEAARWRVGEGRALLRLKRVSAALDALEAPIRNNPEMDAERLATLVEAYAQRDNAASLAIVLDQLRAVYPQSSADASALSAAGNFYVRRGDWDAAARVYQPLAELFPQTAPGGEADWRVAWSYYLQRDNSKARQAFAHHILRYPNSPYVAAALYWLARLAEDGGSVSEARSLDELIEKRFAQGYYAEQARARWPATRPSPTSGGEANSHPGSLAETLAQKIQPPEAPAASLCADDEPSAALRPFLTLKSLALEGLAEQYLRTESAEHPFQPELLLAQSRFEAAQGVYNPSVIDTGRLVPHFPEYEFSALPKQVWDLLYPQAYWPLVEREAKERGIDPYLVMGLIRQESAFDPLALSTANARGLMQILPGTARSRRGRRVSARQLYDPEVNVRVGVSYLESLESVYHGTPEEAIAAYHAGEARVNEWLSQRSFRDPTEFLETIPIPATRAYVEKVLRDAAIYRRLMTGAPQFRKCEGKL